MLDMVLFLPGLLVGGGDVPVLGGGDLLLSSRNGRDGAIKPLLLLITELFSLLVSGDNGVDNLCGVLLLPELPLDLPALPSKLSLLLSSLMLFLPVVVDDDLAASVDDDDFLDIIDTVDIVDTVLVLVLAVVVDDDTNLSLFLPEDDGEVLVKCFSGEMFFW